MHDIALKYFLLTNVCNQKKKAWEDISRVQQKVGIETKVCGGGGFKSQAKRYNRKNRIKSKRFQNWADTVLQISHFRRKKKWAENTISAKWERNKQKAKATSGPHVFPQKLFDITTTTSIFTDPCFGFLSFFLYIGNFISTTWQTPLLHKSVHLFVTQLFYSISWLMYSNLLFNVI